MLAQDLMTTPIVSVLQTASIVDAIQLMLANRISGLPVVDLKGSLVGIVSEGDFLHRGELNTAAKSPWWMEFLARPGKTAEQYARTHGRVIEEIMSRNVVTVDRKAPIEQVVALMTDHDIKRLPVTDDGEVVGIVSRADILRGLAEAHPRVSDATVKDSRIRSAILAELADKNWAGKGLIRVKVRDGVVELAGTIFNEEARMAARVAAENVPGVKSVTDHLDWIEPYTGMAIMPAEEAASGPGTTGKR